MGRVRLAGVELLSLEEARLTIHSGQESLRRGNAGVNLYGHPKCLDRKLGLPVVNTNKIEYFG